MKRPAIRILDLSGSPDEMGDAHGRAFADEIRHYTNERVDLVTAGSWSGGQMSRADVLDLAESMIPAHEKHAPELASEMHAMAAAAGISSAEAIVVGGFTDFVDTVRATIGGDHPDEVIEDDCTAFIVPSERCENGQGMYGQTWDMHDSATEHVVLFRCRPDDAPASLVFTTTGCLGQIGMSELGVCVGINNLVATDGTPGVTWPQVVRAALGTTTAQRAKDVVLGADLAGGHNFCVFDGEGYGYSIEAMPTARPYSILGDEALVHTNHTLAPETTERQGHRDDSLQDSSVLRLAAARAFLDRRDLTPEDLMELTRDPDAVCQTAREPYHIESSGAAVMRPSTLDFWACWGLPSHNDFVSIGFA